MRVTDRPWRNNHNTITLTFDLPHYDSFYLQFDENSLIPTHDESSKEKTSFQGGIGELVDLTTISSDFKSSSADLRRFMTTTSSSLLQFFAETTADLKRRNSQKQQLRSSTNATNSYAGQRSKVRRRRQVQPQHSLARFHPQVESTYKCISYDNHTYKVHSIDGW